MPSASADLRRRLLSIVERRGHVPLPDPVLARAHQTGAVCDYLAWWATHPNPSGTFAARTRWLRRLPRGWLVSAMFALRYDGLIYVDAGAVGPPFDRGGYSVVMLLDFVAYASQVPGVRRARIGRGQNNVTRRFLQRLKAQETALGWQVDLDGWVHFAAATPG